MKKKEIKSALDALKSIRIPKIENEEVKKAVIKNHLKLLSENKKLEEELSNLDKVHLGAYDEERNVVAELQQKLNLETDNKTRIEIINEINSHQEFLSAWYSLNREQSEKLEEPIEIELEPIDIDKFIEEYQKQDYDLRVVEALYPMLNSNNS